MGYGLLHKNLLLKLLNRFVEVCDNNHLQYFLAGGTALGAVRHKGMIPWDDDIDVFMPRNEYEKLQELPPSTWGEGYRLGSWKTIKNYPYDFLKLELLNTTLIERIHPDYVGFVFLDIFPIDRFPNDAGFIHGIESDLKKVYSHFIECTIKHDSDCKSVMELVTLHIKRALYNHRKCMEELEGIAMRGKDTGELMCDFHNYFYCHGGWSSAYFEKSVQMEFEGKTYSIAVNWDGYLRHLYGEYMIPPPIENRKGHGFDFINYDRRLTPAEIKRELRIIHKKYRYRFSLKREIKIILGANKHNSKP